MRKINLCLLFVGLLVIGSGCGGNREGTDASSSQKETAISSKTEQSKEIVKSSSAGITSLKQDVANSAKFEPQAILFGEDSSGIQYVDFSIGITNPTDQELTVDARQLRLSFSAIVEGMEPIEEITCSDGESITLQPQETKWLESTFEKIGNQVLGNYELTLAYEGTPVMEHAAFDAAIRSAVASGEMQVPDYATQPLVLENTTWINSEMGGHRWGIKWDEKGEIYLLPINGDWEALKADPVYQDVQIEKVNNQTVVVNYFQRNAYLHIGMMYPFLMRLPGGLGGGGISNRGDVEHKTTFVFSPDHTSVTSSEQRRYMVKTFIEGAPEEGDQLNVWSEWAEIPYVTYTFQRE
ncbi:hypothetical protein [Enterococcus sp. AZ109]|uniref:hypothetical protein n=1 Tax=Enterococcus sp. AZ109 TaxID=2774634 RepID=UPI003F29E20E